MAADTSPSGNRNVTLLLTIIGALLVGILILLLVLVLRGGDAPAESPSAGPSASTSPSPSPSPSASPSPSETTTTTTTTTMTTTTTQAPSGPTFSSFSVNTSVAACPDEASQVELDFSWSSSNATAAWIGVATSNAKAAPYDGPLSPTGDYTLYYQCSNASQTYTVTLEDGDGRLAHKTSTITRVGMGG